MNVPADVLDLVQETVLIVKLNVKLVEMVDVPDVQAGVMQSVHTVTEHVEIHAHKSVVVALVAVAAVQEIPAVVAVVETVMAVQGVTDVLVVMVVRVLVMAPACLDVYTLAKGIVKTDVLVHVLVDAQEVANSQRKVYLAVEQVQSLENSHPALTKTEYIL